MSSSGNSPQLCKETMLSSETDFGTMPGTPQKALRILELAALIHVLRGSWVRGVRSILFSKQKASGFGNL